MPSKPNVIVFFSDQQRWDTCGCYGQSLPVTPNLDKMASEGIRFEHAYTCQPVCGPARACLQTGKYATEVNCPKNHYRLPPEERTIAQEMSDQGYSVGYIGKWHLASWGKIDGVDNFRTLPVPPELRGGYKDFWLASDVLEYTSHGYDGYMFDSEGNKREFPEGRYRVDAQTDWVLEYLRAQDQDKPFFLFVSYIEPHHQNDHHHFEGPHGSKDMFRDFEVPGDLVDTEGDWREEYPDYLGCCHSLDRNLGRICDALEDLGISDNTLLLYLSDHGNHFRTRNGEYKRSCHDASIRVPMVACGPGFTGGKVQTELTSLIDIPPTILKAAGMATPERMRGRPLQDLVSGNAKDWPEEVFVQISESQCGRAIRTARWKYSVTAPDTSPTALHSESYVEDYLYDMEADPHERNNLVSSPDHAEIRASLRHTLIRRMAEAGEPEPEIRPHQ